MPSRRCHQGSPDRLMVLSFFPMTARTAAGFGPRRSPFQPVYSRKETNNVYSRKDTNTPRWSSYDHIPNKASTNMYGHSPRVSNKP
jgi:hypothetical protein